MVLNFGAILSAFASIISKPALMRSKKLLSVVDDPDGGAKDGGKDLNGGNVGTDTSVTSSFSFGSSEPKSSEKKSMESLSSSSSSSFCLDSRLNFIDRRQS